MLKLSFRNQVLTGFAVSIILVFLVAVFSFRSITQLEKDQAKVEQSEVLIHTSRDILQNLIDAETGMRGFVAMDKPAFLDPYKAALPLIRNNVAKLKELAPNNPYQQKDLDSLYLLTDRQLEMVKNNIDVRDVVGLQYMVDHNMLLNGKHIMDDIRETIARINTREDKALADGRARTQSAANYTILTIFIGSVIFLAIIIILFIYIQKTFDQQKKIEEEIRVANIELGVVLAENEAKNWLLTGTGLLNEKMQGQQSERELAENILTEVCNYTKAFTGTFYLYNEGEERLELYSSYAFHDLSALKKTVKLSEGLLGQVAVDKKTVTIKGKLNDKLAFESSIVHDDFIESIILPFSFDKQLKGVMELAFQGEVGSGVLDYIDRITSDVGVAVNTSQARTIMHDLFEETQQQAEELEAQQEEMRVTNEELMNKTEMLEASEEELRVQQEELRSINAELEEKASLLEEKNQAIEEARASINIKVQELETTGKYKSEFLANMSH